MKKRSKANTGAVLIALTVASWTASAGAQESSVYDTVEPSAPLTAAEPEFAARVKRTPNEELIVGGAFLFGVSYGAAVIGSWQSDLRADDKLLIPLAGPWIDLANRPACGDGFGRPSCALEDTNKVLLVADGVLQGLGAIQILGGLMFPKTEVVMVRVSKNVKVAPQAGRNGLGVAASGVF